MISSPTRISCDDCQKTRYQPIETVGSEDVAA
jgi:hypothetical protein